jgi:serine/threonine protein phosphatase PrpC
VNCPACQAVCSDDSKFCEDCGSALQAVEASAEVDPALRCVSCGAGPTAIDNDGFCTQCGNRRLAPKRNHMEDALSAKAAGVSDIGKRYEENQDYFLLAKGPHDQLIAIVCDGVSLSQNAKDGSKAACEAAIAAIQGDLARGVEDPDQILKDAMHNAQEAICKVPFTPGLTDAHTGEVVPPAQATAVAVVVAGSRVTIGWLGDSRAYWASGKRARQLTVDHSWFNDVVGSGEMTAEQARNDKRARGIVRSLGAELDGTNPGAEPDALTLNLTEPGALLVVSDGFYTYADEPKIVSLVGELPKGIDALSLARHLVDHARESGGSDNITVVAIALP